MLLLRGVRYRAGRSAVVALLATAAVAAAVLAPAYSRAAQQSLLTDGLATAPPVAVGLTVSAADAPVSAADARRRVDAVLAEHRWLARVLAPVVVGADTDALVTGGQEPFAARIAYRDGVCGQLTVAGDCPVDAGQVLVSARTADTFGTASGDVLTLDGGREVAVVGTYSPVDASVAYWGRTAYFTHGGFDPVSGAARTDALFTGAEEGVGAAADGAVNLGLTYPLRPGAVRLDDLPGLRADLRAFDGAVRVAGLEPVTALPSILDQVAVDSATIARTAPVIAVPLALLACFVLLLLVAAVTEERGREIALAKLRGFSGARAARFGLAEVLVLVVVAAPFGLALGLGAVTLAARATLAEGTPVELRWPVALVAVAAVAATGLAAVLAARATLRRGVLELLRQVPTRGRARAAVAEAVVVTLAVTSLVAVVDHGPLALLAPALLALVAGVGAARLMRLWSALRLRRARRRGHIPRLLSAAALSRRPGAKRVVVVVTVAVALLGFAATAWDVAAQARQDHAVDALGADRVYVVEAEHPGALVDAVRAADPDGAAMAVVRANQTYAGEQVELLAVESPRLVDVAVWRGRDPAAVTAAAGRLRPPLPEPLRVSDRVEVTAKVVELGEEPVRLSALVTASGGPPRSVSLGSLEQERSRYGAPLVGCDDGCRLLGFTLGRVGAPGAVTATVTIEAVRSSGEELAARFDEPGAWSGPITPGPALTVAANGGSGDVVIEHQDTLPALPVVLAGDAPDAAPEATEFSFPGFAEQPQPFVVADRVTRLPRAGERGLLFDVEYAVRAAERTAALAEHSALRYEVWASPAAPADLPARLAAAGVSVAQVESTANVSAQLSRRAPALGWWLCLLAGAASVALALGTVWLSTRVGLRTRSYELAALRVGGVPADLLRRGLVREHLAMLAGPLVLGFATGVAGAGLMLPALPLVETGVVVSPGYRPQWGALPVAALAVTAVLLTAVVLAARLPGRVALARLRGGL